MIVVDTHAWYWWVIEDSRLQTRTHCVARKRIVLNRNPVLWMRTALEHPKCRLLDITIELANDAATLEWDHGDPADRMIVATALAHDARVIFPPARAIW